MADSSVPITPGSGASVDTFQVASGDHQQVVREARATAATTPTSWTVTTGGQASVIAADANRVRMLLVSNASGRVYLRFDTTIPTATSYHFYLESGDRWEVPAEMATLPVSMVGAIAGGTVLAALATAS